MIRKLLLPVALFSFAASAHAENRVVKCNTYRARHAPVPEGPALVANVARSMRPIPLDAVQFTDKKLTRQMVVESLFSRPTDSGTTEVVARFVNCTSETLAVRVRVSFLDADQAPTEPTSTWRTQFIPARGTGVYSERSIAARGVTNYLIELAGN